MDLVWSDEARQSLFAMLEFIGRGSPARASAYIAKIRTRADKLKRFPLIGRVVPELREEPGPPREIIIDHYRVIYRIRRHNVEVITVFHGRRGLSSVPSHYQCRGSV